MIQVLFCYFFSFFFAAHEDLILKHPVEMPENNFGISANVRIHDRPVIYKANIL